MSRVVAIIQARLGSSRLPRKVLADIGGRPLLAHVIERARAIIGVDDVILALPGDERDLWALAEREGWGPYCSFQVATNDVLGRIMGVVDLLEAEGAPPEAILRLTADCPLLAPDVAELALDEFQRQGVDYLGTTHPALAYPDGLDVEIIRREALEVAHREATDPEDREHVTRFLWRQPERFKVAPVKWTCCTARGCLLGKLLDDPCVDGRCKVMQLKLSVDVQADLDQVLAICRHLPVTDFSFSATLRAARAAGVL